MSGDYDYDTDVPSLIGRIEELEGYVAELEPRVLEGDWETVRDALDALPEGAQIRWQEGYPLHSFVGMKTTSVFGDTRWSSVGSDGSFDHLSSTGIAHNDSAIEVLA